MNCCKPDHPTYTYPFPHFPNIGYGKTASGPPPHAVFSRNGSQPPLFSGSGKRFDIHDYQALL